jgi:hypothetical protein
MVNKYIFTDKVDSMQTRMQSLGSYFLVHKQLQQFIVYFNVYKVNPVCTKDGNTKH